MMYRLAIWALLLAGIVCLAQQTPTRAYWQTRDTAYNNPVAVGGGSVTLDTFPSGNLFTTGTALSYTGMTTTSGDTLLLGLLYVRQSNLTDISSVIWDPGATNQTMTQVATLCHTTGTVNFPVFIYGVTNPTLGNKTLQINNTGSFVYYVGAASYKGTNTTFGSAVTSVTAQNVQASPLTASVTVAAGHHGLNLLHTATNASSSASCSGSPNDQSNGGRACGYDGTGTVSGTITNDVSDDSCSLTADISP